MTSQLMYPRNWGRLGPVLMVAGTVGLSGCFGGSSSSSNGDDPAGAVSLTEEEQVVGAAVQGIQRARMVQEQGENQAVERQDPEDEETDSASLAVATASGTYSTQSVTPIFTCDEGAYRFNEGGEQVALSGADFPAPFSNDFSDTNTPNDAVLRSDCVNADDDGVVYRYEGALDVVDRSDIDNTGGRVTLIRAGGFAGATASDTPDVSRSMEFETGGGFGASRMRMQVFNCEGCMDGDLSDFNSTNPKLDVTSVSFGELEMDIQGLVAHMRTGTSLDDPFIFQSKNAGSGIAEVSLTGLLMFDDQDSGCGYDVTYQTIEPLQINDYDSGNSETVDGTINVTSNESGRTFEVTYHPEGDLTVIDTETGSPVSTEPSEDAMACGFFAGDGGALSEGDLEGTWTRGCEQHPTITGAYTTDALTFGADGAGSREANRYSDSACTDVEDTLVIGFNYHVGFGVPSTNDVAAAELDLTDRHIVSGDPGGFDDSSLYGVFGIEGNTLYLDDFEMDESMRPGELDPVSEYIRN